MENYKFLFSSVSQSCPTLCDPLSVTNSQSLFKLMSIESVMPFSYLILYRPRLLPPSIFPSIRAFSNESALHIRWPRYWSFSFSSSPSNEYSELISLRMYWLDLLAVQGTPKGLPRAFSPHQNHHQLPPPLQVEAKGKSSPIPGSSQEPADWSLGPLLDDAVPALTAQ